MNTAKILSLLRNSGFHVLGADGTYIFLEDPACFLRSLSEFMDVAWVIIGFITGVLLFGWGVAIIRGAANNIVTNLRNMVLIFGVLALAKPAVNLIWGDDLFTSGCKVIQVPIEEVNRALAARDARLGGQFEDNVEIFDIWDSAKNEDYLEAMRDVDLNAALGTGMNLSGAGVPELIENVQVSGGTMLPTRLNIASANGHRVVNAMSVLSPDEIQAARQVFANSGMAIRIQDNSGGGGVGARRRDQRYASGYRDHEGRDLLIASDRPVPSLFAGRVASVRPMHHGLWSMTIRNDDGTTTFMGYVRTALNAGDRVRAGDIVAYSQKIAMAPEYKNVPNHVHYELWSGNKGSSDIMDLADIF